MEINELVAKLRTITDGTFLMPSHSSTLMGWSEKYDNQNRLVTVDPNWKDYEVTIDGTTYHVTKKGWKVCIWKPGYNKLANYTSLMGTGFNHPGLLTVIDTTPDYVNEYWNIRKMENNKIQSVTDLYDVKMEKDHNKMINSMAEFFKDYRPLKGSYEHFKHQYEFNNCKMIKFMFNTDTSAIIPKTGSIKFMISYLSEVPPITDYIDESPSELVNYIILYNNSRTADGELSKEYHNYIFNANSLIAERIKKYNELVEKKHREELPEINRIKGILNEII